MDNIRKHQRQPKLCVGFSWLRLAFSLSFPAEQIFMALMEDQLQRSFLGFRTGNQQLPCKVHAIPIRYYRLLHIYIVLI